MKQSKMKSTDSPVGGDGIEFDEFQKDLELTMSMRKNKKPKKPKKESDDHKANDSEIKGRLDSYRDYSDDDQQPGTSTVRSRVVNGRKRKPSDSSNEGDLVLKANIPPDEMRQYTKSLLTMLTDRDPVSSPQAKFFHLYEKPDYVPKGHPNEALKTEMERYYKYATKKTVVSMRAMAFSINDFLNNPRSVETYTDFPVRPSRSPFHLFMGTEQKRLSAQKSKVKFTDRAKMIHEQWAKGKELQAKYNDLWAREREEYISKLDQFVETHAELMEQRREYLLYINKLRADVLSMLNKNQGGGKKTAKVNGKAKKAKMTAFDFFKQSKKDKYVDLPTEERERKLMKRFNKLEEEQREIFESLANNQ